MGHVESGTVRGSQRCSGGWTLESKGRLSRHLSWQSKVHGGYLQNEAGNKLTVG